jgi:hypothetical protein
LREQQALAERDAAAVEIERLKALLAQKWNKRASIFRER